MKKLISVVVLMVIVAGCASVVENQYAIVSTQSGIGFSVGIKETNQTPEVRLGYIRNEMVFIPTEGEEVAPVFARLNYQSIWSKGGGIASVVSTGDAAINQSCFQEGVQYENSNEGK